MAKKFNQQRSRQRRTFHRSNSKQQDSHSNYDTDDEGHFDDGDDDDHSIVELQVSTTELVEESNFQVKFCEMTAQEMNQVLQWWSSQNDVNDEDENQSSILPHNSLFHLGETPHAKEEQSQQLLPKNCEEEPGSLPNFFATEETLPNTEDHSIHLLVDQPLPQDVTCRSPIRRAKFNDEIINTAPKAGLFTTMSGSDEIPDFGGLRSYHSPEELHESVCVQHEEVTRLLFETRDMADQVAALTESSATEEDEDASMLEDSEPEKMLTPPLPPPRRSNLRRRRRGNKNADIPTTPKASSSWDESTTGLQLDWQDHLRLWLFRQGMKVEMAVVSQVLVPGLPLPLLLFLLNRPKTFRKLLWSLLLLLAVALPILAWWYFPEQMKMAEAPLPSMDLFLRQPSYDRDYHYLPTPSSSNPVRTLFLEGGQDFGMI